jgi:hypothetical protein
VPEQLELDESEPEVTRLFGGVVSLGRSLRGTFPLRRRDGIKWRYFGHQGFPWCPVCGVMIAGSAPYHRDRRKESPGMVAHQGYHDDIDELAALIYQVADLLGIDTERDDSGTDKGDPAGGSDDRG